MATKAKKASAPAKPVAKKPVQVKAGQKKPVVDIKKPKAVTAAPKTENAKEIVTKGSGMAKKGLLLKLPVVDKVQVVKVLDVGHTKTHFHCKMANGTTVHVPKSKFSSHNIDELNNGR